MYWDRNLPKEVVHDSFESTGVDMGAPIQPKPDIAFHDRLDLLLHVDDYVDQPCGTVSRSDGEKKYCCNQCPTLKKDIVEGK